MANAALVVYYILLALLFIGGLNWGLYAISPSANVVEAIFGMGSVVSKVIFVLVALAALAAIILTFASNSNIFKQ